MWSFSRWPSSADATGGPAARADRRGLLRRAGALLLLVGASACARLTDPPRDPFGGEGGRPRAAEVRIEVRNDNFNEATLYALSPGRRRRVGRVDGNGRARFRIPWTVTDPVRFEIDILGVGRCTTRPLTVGPGDVVEVLVDSVVRPRADGFSRICDVQRGR